MCPQYPPNRRSRAPGQISRGAPSATAVGGTGHRCHRKRVISVIISVMLVECGADNEMEERARPELHNEPLYVQAHPTT